LGIARSVDLPHQQIRAVFDREERSTPIAVIILHAASMPALGEWRDPLRGWASIQIEMKN
jgi:hypothetical protein